MTVDDRVRRRATSTLVAVVAIAATVLAGCGSGGGTAHKGGSGHSGSDHAAGHGTVRVLYAGSLLDLMEHSVAGRFHSTSGYTMHGEAKGSQALANEIKGKTTRADVFLSANTDTNDTLTGASNGNWVSWYVTFASAPLVLGYNPKSKFAADLKSKPWQQVVTQPGFRLGRTDPKLDPKGKLSVTALKKVGLGDKATGTDGVYPEETLVGRLQAGQLDAGFFYSSEAAEQKIPTVPLKPVSLSATYTVTVVNRAPHPAAAAAFVKFLLGKHGASLLRHHGLTVTQPPSLTGDRGAVPTALASALPAG